MRGRRTTSSSMLFANNSSSPKPLQLSVSIACNATIKDILDRLRKGEPANQTAEHGRTLLQVAVENSRSIIVDMLLFYGADPSATNNFGGSNLEWSLVYGLRDSCFLLLEKGAEFCSDIFGFFFRGNIPLVLDKLESLDDPKSLTDAMGNTFLHYAVALGMQADRMEELIERYGFNYTATNRVGESLLHLAARLGYIETVCWLIETQKITDISIRTALGETVLSLAVKGGFDEIVCYLFGNQLVSAEKGLLHAGCAHGQTGMVEMLLSRGFDLQEQDVKSRTPLHIAALNGHTELVDFLISKGAAVRARDMDGRTALHLASQVGHLETVKLLIKHGCRLQSIDLHSYTPLDYSRAAGSVFPVALRLLDKGLSLGEEEYTEMFIIFATLLQLSYETDDEDVAARLIAYFQESSGKFLSFCTQGLCVTCVCVCVCVWCFLFLLVFVFCV